jgi:hypothetical protein
MASVSQNSTNGKRVQPIRVARVPRNVPEVVPLAEACRRYQVYDLKIYAAIQRGQLHPVQRKGRMLYLLSELEAVFGGRASYPDPSEPAAAMFAAA